MRLLEIFKAFFSKKVYITFYHGVIKYSETFGLAFIKNDMVYILRLLEIFKAFFSKKGVYHILSWGYKIQ